MKPIVREINTLGKGAEHRYLINNNDYRDASTIAKRLWLRIRMYVFYPLYFLYSETRYPSKYCVVCTNTFYTPLLSTLIPSAQRSSIHLLYDLFPDALTTAGKLSTRNAITRTVEWIVDTTFQRSSANVILGQRLKAHIEHRLPKNKPSVVIPVGTDSTPFEPTIHKNKLGNKISLLYSGNFGHLHDVSTLSDALSGKAAADLPISFCFSGKGPGINRLKTKLGDRSLAQFLPSLEETKWTKKMTESQIGLVTMRLGAEKILLPSKTFSAMAAGQAILAICSEESDLANLVTKHDCGWVVAPGDTTSLEKTLSELSSKPEELYRKRTNARNAVLKHYDATAVAIKWLNLFALLEHSKNSQSEVQ